MTQTDGVGVVSIDESLTNKKGRPKTDHPFHYGLPILLES